MFYESKNSLTDDLVKLEYGVDFTFPDHMHSAFELIQVTDGEMDVCIDNIQYTLAAGEAVLIFPNQIHALKTNSHSQHRLCIFSSRLVHAYDAAQMGLSPTSNRFAHDALFMDKLFDISPEDTLMAKGILYSLCAQFHKKAQYRPSEPNAGGLLAQIFMFVEAHFKEDCSLAALSQHTGYHSVYLSRYFRQCTAMTYTDYVTRSRINEAAYLLKNTQEKMINIAFSCGFNSLRSFNRSFRTVMNTSPTQYRRN